MQGRKVGEKDGRRDGKTNRPYLTGQSLLPPEVQNVFNNSLCNKCNPEGRLVLNLKWIDM